MKRGDLVKMKESAALSAAVAWATEEVEEVASPGVVGSAAWAMRVGVIIEVIEDVPNDRYVVYWSDNIKSTHWATDLEMK